MRGKKYYCVPFVAPLPFPPINRSDPYYWFSQSHEWFTISSFKLALQCPRYVVSHRHWVKWDSTHVKVSWNSLITFVSGLMFRDKQKDKQTWTKNITYFGGGRQSSRYFFGFRSILLIEMGDEEWNMMTKYTTSIFHTSIFFSYTQVT